MKTSGHLTRTLILLKPDAIQRNLAGEIIKRFERKGLRLVASEMRWIDKKLAEEHYAEHKGNHDYFEAMTNALTCGPLMAIVLEGNSAVEASRQLIGAQSPIYHSQVGTIRADLSIEEPFNLVHGSDSDGSAQREIKLWFGTQLTKVTQPKKVVPQVNPMDLPAPPKLPKKIKTEDLGKKVVAMNPQELDKFKNDLIKAVTSSGVIGDVSVIDELSNSSKAPVWEELLSVPMKAKA